MKFGEIAPIAQCCTDVTGSDSKMRLR